MIKLPGRDQETPAGLLLGESKFEILESLLDGERTAEEIAKILDVNVSAARDHLTRLEKARFVASRFRRGGVGRPNRVYSISEIGRELFPRRYDWFLTRLLGTLSRTDPALAKRTVARMSAELATSLRERTREAKANPTAEEEQVGLVESLNELGFRAWLERRSGREDESTIVRTDCAVLKVAKSNPKLICEVFDTELLKSVLGADVELQETMARGATRCAHLVKLHGGRSSATTPD